MRALTQGLVLSVGLGTSTVALVAGQGFESAVYRVGPGVSAPILVREVRPEYTDAAREARVQGTVTLDCVVLPDGTIRDAEAVQSWHSVLDDQAIKAVRQWRFKPGMKDGKPVPVRIAIELTFLLR